MPPIFLLLKSRRNTYLHPLIKFLLPNTLPFGKTWWAPSQNLPHNTKNGFIKSQSKQVCLSCCIKKKIILSAYGISTPLFNPYIHTDLYALVSPFHQEGWVPKISGFAWLWRNIPSHTSPSWASQMTLWEQFLLNRSMAPFCIAYSVAEALWALTTHQPSPIIIEIQNKTLFSHVLTSGVTNA